VTPGPFSLAGGTICLADVEAGTALTASTAAATLDQSILGGTLSVFNTWISVTGGLTLANGAEVQVGDASHTGEIDLQGDETVSGTGTISFVGPGGTVKTLANVTLGPGITVHGTSGSLGIITGTLTNQRVAKGTCSAGPVQVTLRQFPHNPQRTRHSSSDRGDDAAQLAPYL
jgi:hypothetical protein